MRRQLMAKVIAGLIALAGTIPVPSAQAASLSSAFTYQGRLNDGSGPADGLYDFEFKLYPALIGGTQVGSTVTSEEVMVESGLFTATPDFGELFGDNALWLQIAVRPSAGAGAFTPLTPRQALTAGPFALYAPAAGNAATLGGQAASAFASAFHSHFGQIWSGSAPTGLSIVTSSTADGATGFHARQGDPIGAAVVTPRGLWGESREGVGVYGTSLSVIGVYGASAEAAGVFGFSEGNSDQSSGVQGNSAAGNGVHGQHFGTTGVRPGVLGETLSTDAGAVGVLGQVVSIAPGFNSAGVRGINNGTGIDGIGVFGSHAGSGIGVQGSSGSGIGVYGTTSSGVGVYAQSSLSSTSTALQIDGAIRVGPGGNRPIFIHSALASNSCSGGTVIDSPLANGDSSAIVIVVHNMGSVSANLLNSALGVVYDKDGTILGCPTTPPSENHWVILPEDPSVSIPNGAQFNVMVVRQ